MKRPSTDTRCCDHCIAPTKDNAAPGHYCAAQGYCLCHTEPKEWEAKIRLLLESWLFDSSLRSEEAIKSFITEAIAKEVEKEREIQSELYEALQMMWEQYCPPPHTHQYMTAGENCEEVLGRYWYLRPHKLK